MYNLKITKEATEDIDKIIAYITNVLKNPIAADNLFDWIWKKLKRYCL